MTAYMDHKDLANETIDEGRAQQIADGVHRVLDRIAQAEMEAGREPRKRVMSVRSWPPSMPASV